MAKEIETAKLQTTWRAAYRKPDPLVIPCPTIATARNIRFRLYGAVKDIRKGAVQADPELVAAIDALQVSAIETPTPRVVLQRKTALDLLDVALAAEGFDAGSIKSTEQIAMEESLQRMAAVQASLETPSVGAVGLPEAPARERANPAEIPDRPIGTANPFFTRGNGPGQSS